MEMVAWSGADHTQATCLNKGSCCHAQALLAS